MNAKGTRFLAVLAVLAMAFAALAVVDLSDANSYSNREIQFEPGEIVLNPGETISAGGAYYIDADKTITVTAPSTAAVIIFLYDGAQLTINSTTTTVGIYSVQKMATTTPTTSAPLLKLVVKNGLKAACIDDDAFVVPALADVAVETDGYKHLADLDLPAGAKYTVKAGSVTAEADAEFTIAEAWTLKATVKFTGEDGALSMETGSMFNGTVIYDYGTESFLDDAQVKLLLKASGNGATIAAGSIEISGSFTGEGLKAKIAEAGGDVILTNVTVTAGTVTIDTPVEIQELTIAAGATVNLNSTPTNTENPLADPPVINVNGTLNQGTGVDLIDAEIDGTGEVNNVADENEMETLIVKGNSADGVIVFPAFQRVVVEQGWTLVPGADVTIKGELYIPEGITVTVSHDASLTIANDAIVTVEGTIVIEDDEDDEDYTDGEMFVITGTVNVEGYIDVQGVLTLSGATAPIFGTVNINEGIVYVANTGALIGDDYSQLNVGSSSLLDVEGALAIDTVYNYGIVSINSLVPAFGDSEIYQMADGATVYVINYTALKTIGDMDTLTISDAKLIVYTDRNGNESTVLQVEQGAANSVVIEPTVNYELYAVKFSGLTVTESLKTTAGVPGTIGYLEASGKNYTNKFTLTGDLTQGVFYYGEEEPEVNDLASEVTVEVNSGRGVVIEDDTSLIVNSKVKFHNNGILDVYGTLDADSSKDIRNVNGTVTVYGDGVIYALKAALADTINACEYKVGDYYIYVSMDTALDLVNELTSITNVKVRGTNYVTRDNVIPDKVTFTLANNPTVYVGSTSNNDILLYIEDEGTIKGEGTIYVDASMYAETAKSVKTANVISDVKTQEMKNGKVLKSGWVLWTNLTKALNTAQPGDVVTIARETEYVEIGANTEIKEGVTLKVPAEFAALFLKDGVTLTVNGTLDTEKEIYAETKFAVKAKNLQDDKSSAIVVNGVLMTTLLPFYDYVADGPTPALMSNGAPIAGAYYSIDGVNYITTLEIALFAVDIIDDGSNITINGEVTEGDLYFVASESCDNLVLGVGISADIPTKLTVSSIVLDGSKITSAVANANNGTFTGSIVVDDAVLDAKGIKGGEAALNIADKSGKLSLVGYIAGSSLKVAEGIVYVANGADVHMTLSVASNSALVANGGNAQIRTLNLDGILTVPNGKGLAVETMNLSGSFAVASSTQTEAAGTLVITDLFAGIKESDYTTLAAVPVMAGTFTLENMAAVIAGAVTDDEAEAVFDACYSNEYYVNGKLWFTAYSPGLNAIHVNKAPIEDAWLAGWTMDPADEDDAVYLMQIGTRIGTPDKWYAVIETHIYSVIVYTDAGVKSVAIDGIQLVAPEFGVNIFTTTDNSMLEAGVHTITFTYQSGYTGTVNLYTYPDGTILKDYKFTVSGTPEEDPEVIPMVTYLQLTGTEQAIEPTPEPEPVPEEKEWTITTILLLILVILIAVMAVIVALRLNRN